VEDTFWKDRKVLAFAHAAGGGDVIAPIVRTLRENGADLLLLAKEPARSRFRSHDVLFLDFYEYSDASIDAVCKKQWDAVPDLVFTSASSLATHDMTERYLWKWAKARGVPSAAILDQWQNYALRFSGVAAEEKLQYLPDRILVMDQVAFDDAVAEGLPHDRLRIAGQPALDDLSRRCSLETARRLRREIKVSDDTQLVVFVAESLRADFGDSLGYDEHTMLKFLVDVLSTYLKAGQANSLHVLVKLHPQNRMDQFTAELADALFPTTVIAQQYQPVEVLQAADLVVGMSSIFLVHAIMMEKPTVSLQLGSKKPSQLIATRVGAIPFLREEHTAREVLMSLLQDKQKREAYVARQRQWDFRKGDSVLRVLSHLESVIREANR
jgi:hypothetical protein